MGRRKEYEVNLSDAERNHLKNIISSGEEKARKITRARVLLRAAEGWLDREISDALDINQATVGRVRKKYAEEGFDAALNRKKSCREYESSIDGASEAHLIAMVCGDPPEGYSRWTYRLIADRFVQLEQVDLESVSHETIRRKLKKRSQTLAIEAVGDSSSQ